MKISLKKKIAAAAAAATIVGGVGIAYGYWTSTGAGDGSATTGSATNDLLITQSTAPTNLAPGVAAGAITGTIQNTQPIGGQNEHVGSVTVSIASVDKAVGAPAGTCTAADYTLSDPVMVVNSDLAPQATANFSGASLAFNNDPANSQDGCQGATVNLHYASN